jgi:predicted dehydrogenase
MSEQRLRVGLVGGSARRGWSKVSHVPALLALPEYELAAVCTSSPESAAEAAAAFGAEGAYSDYRRLVEDPSLDLVSVSVGVPSHRDIVVAALEAGKHVYCEWPLGATTAEAEEMATLAAGTELRTMVGLQARGDPTLLHLKELIAEGYVGEVLSCTVTMFLGGLLQRGDGKAWMADAAAGANAFTILGGHALDVVGFCVDELDELTARVATQVSSWDTADGGSVPVSAPDNLLLHGLLRQGALVSLHVAMVPWHGSGWRMEVYGREGTLVATTPRLVEYGGIRLAGARGDERQLQELESPPRLTWIPQNVERDERFNVAQMYRQLGRAIRLGDDVDIDADFALAAERHRLLDLLRDSTLAGAAGTVPRPSGPATRRLT